MTVLISLLSVRDSLSLILPHAHLNTHHTTSWSTDAWSLATDVKRRLNYPFLEVIPILCRITVWQEKVNKGLFSLCCDWQWTLGKNTVALQVFVTKFEWASANPSKRLKILFGLFDHIKDFSVWNNNRNLTWKLKVNNMYMLLMEKS